MRGVEQVGIPALERELALDVFNRLHCAADPGAQHGVETFVIDGRTVDATYLQTATVPLNVTGLPGVSMRFGTSRDGPPINVQIVGNWLAEATILHVASLLESVSSVRGLRPAV